MPPQRVVKKNMGVDGDRSKVDIARTDPHVLEAVARFTETGLAYLDTDFNFVWVNDKYARMAGRDRNEFPGHNHFEFYPHPENEAIFRRVLETGEPHNAVAKPFVYPDHPEWGVTYWDWTLTPDNDDQGNVRGLVLSLVNVTERIGVETNQDLMVEALRILNRGEDFQTMIKDLLRFIREFTGFDAVGFRLRDGDDFPYYEQNGFSDEFIYEENSLCRLQEDGSLVRNEDGQPVLECTCGLVLTEQTDPLMPCFTERGSFWTNVSSELLALEPEEDPRTNPRNRCIHMGYQSVGLIPVRSSSKIIGMLQFNDRREGRFTPDFIRFLESLGDNIGLALDRARAEEDLRSTALFPGENPDAVMRVSEDGVLLYANCASNYILSHWGCRTGEQVPEDVLALARKALQSGENQNWDIEYGDRYLEVVFAPIPDSGYVNLYGRDVTARRKAENELRWYHTIASQTADVFLIVRTNGDILGVNEAAVRAYGYSREQLLKMNVRDLRPDSDVPQALQQLEHAVNGLLFEAVHKRRDGTTFPVEINARGVEVGDETVIASIVRDITERKQAENALRESEERVRRKLNSILSPEAGLGQLELADILDIDAVQSIMNGFYKLIPVPMAILDLKGNILVGVGWQDVCTRFHRANPDTCAHCIESDTQLTAGVPPGEFKLYKCKNNMWDVATPIVVGGKHVGNLFAGQFFFDDEEPDFELFRRQARQHGFDEEEYLAAIQKAPRLSRQTVSDGMTFFISIADMISKLSYGNIELARLLAERDSLANSLRESEEHYRTLFTSMSEGFALHEMIYDDDGKPCDYRFLEINSSFERQTGLRREDVVGRCVSELMPNLEPFWMETYARVVQTGSPVRFEYYSSFLGRSYEVIAFRPAEGKFAVFFLDITERKQAEKELEQARMESEQNAAQLQTILSSMADGVSLTDVDGKTVFINEAGMRILGVPAGENPDTWLSKLEIYTLDGDLIPPEQMAALRALRGETTEHTHYRIRLSEDKTFIIGFSASTVRNARGAIIGATTVFHDETERVEFEQRQEELLRREHRIAETLQNALVPPRLPKELMGCRIASIYEPASDEAEVGGDFYDVFELGDDKFGVLLGDIAGKGLQAAIGVASARYAIRAYAYSNPNPADVLTLANNALCSEELQETGMLTAFFAVIDRNAGRLVYANAGHELPVLLNADGTLEELDSAGLPLAIIQDFKYTQSTHDLNAGDMLVVMTDGITEARKSSTDLLGKDRVLRFLADIATCSAEDIASSLIAMAKSHAGGKLQDDAAALVLDLMPPAELVDEPAKAPEELERCKVRTTITGSGSITRGTMQDFEERLNRVKTSGDPAVIDLRCATFVDTSVLSILAETANALVQRGQRLGVVVRDGSYLLRALRLVRFDEIMDIQTVQNPCDEEQWALLEEQRIELYHNGTDMDCCRRAAYSVARTLGFSANESWDITAAFIEACANALEHGNAGIDKPVEVTVRALSDRFEAIIKDHGSGFACPDESPIPPPTSRRGRGLPLMRLIMDEVIFRFDHGCEVTLIKYTATDIR